MAADKGADSLALLFGQGQRPTVDALRDVVAGSDQVTVCGDLIESADYRGLELLRDGMTYDLLGAQHGRGAPVPPVVHRFGAARDLLTDQCEALELRVGPHLAAGSRTMPVVRTMMGVAAMVVPHLAGLLGIAWRPARTLIGPDFFVSSMTAWLAGGAFPALGLTAFDLDDDGGLRSEGLSFFIGQEIRLAPDLAADRAAGTRLGIRLINQLVPAGGMTASESILGPDGMMLMLEPTSDLRFIRVRRG